MSDLAQAIESTEQKTAAEASVATASASVSESAAKQAEMAATEASKAAETVATELAQARDLGRMETLLTTLAAQLGEVRSELTEVKSQLATLELAETEPETEPEDLSDAQSPQAELTLVASPDAGPGGTSETANVPSVKRGALALLLLGRQR